MKHTFIILPAHAISMEGENTLACMASPDGSETKALYVCLPSNEMRKDTMSETYVPTTTSRNRTAIDRALDAEGGVIANQGRLTSYEAEEGRVLLLSYTNEVIAEVTGDGSNVTLFTGHYGQVSQSTTNHIRQLGSVLSGKENKDVTVTDSAPTMGIGSRASESAKYISNYVGSFAGEYSPVELDAMETVEAALQERLQALF